MGKEAKVEDPSCSECHQLNCYRHDKAYPSFCATEAADPADVDAARRAYAGDELDGRLARAAAEVEGKYYGKITRVEEIMAFAHRIGAKKIGIATCLGLIEETRLFAKALRAAGFEPVTMLCKIGSIDKEEIGIPDELKIRPGAFEAACNPILQARNLNAEKTDLNVIVGLCVGHDSLFSRHSEAPVTTLITKDRVLGHNPVAALYTSHSYMKRIFDPASLKKLQPEEPAARERDAPAPAWRRAQPPG
jgi:uncharacterized metal-binding protein